MKLKYSTDEYGNVFSNIAQIDQVDGSICYNDRVETLDKPFTPEKGKRIIVVKGKWEQIPISSGHTTEEINGQLVYRPKTQIERYATGVEEIPKGMKLSDDKKDLIPKTTEERLSSGEITQDEYNTIYNQPIKTALEAIDIKSIRSLREWLAKQPDCPEFIKTYESQAMSKRAELKK